jgi:hypothetical protein
MLDKGRADRGRCSRRNCTSLPRAATSSALAISEFTVNGIKQSIVAGRSLPLGSYEAMHFRPNSYHAGRRSSRLPAWLSLVGIIIPSALQVSIGGANFTAGRIGIALLLVSAPVALFQAGRRALLSDLLALATAIWMVASATYAAGLGSGMSAAAECLELVGGYFVARACFFRPTALGDFICALKVFAVISIVAAMGDVLSGRWIVREILTSEMGGTAFVDAALVEDAYRSSMVRATSTFDHPILFGCFCSLTAGILLYAEQTTPKRIFWGGLCSLGCLLAQSSAAVMALFLILATYAFDCTMTRYQWRWSFLRMVGIVLFLLVFVISDNPVGWVISHFTFDPQTGFYRRLIWNAATTQIAHAPITGAGFVLFGDYLLDKTVDSVWLVVGLRYGIPLIILLVLLNVSSFLPTSRRSIKRMRDLDPMRTAFTLVLLTFMFAGFTVHFWNYMWIFWGLCIGIRASLREQSISEGIR